MPPKRSKPKSVEPQPTRDVESRIVTVRGQRVILSADLARVYGVATKALNQAVQRNVERFPTDFMFRLTLEEARQAEILRSQSVTLRWGTHIKHPPLAFTEHGAVMAATVLNSPRAVQMSIFVVRAFLRLRQLVAGQADLTDTLARLERRVTGHDQELKAIIATLRQLVAPAAEPPRRRIGFARRDD